MIACVTRGLLILIYRTSHKNNDKSYQNIGECNNNSDQNSKKIKCRVQNSESLFFQVNICFKNRINKRVQLRGI